MIRDYIIGKSETLTLVSIGESDGSSRFIKADDIYVNGFSDLTLYTDSGGVTQVPSEYVENVTIDINWTADEAMTGGTGKTVYSQFKVTNVAYQNVTLYATFTNFGVYTSADANFDMVGGSETVTTSATLVVPFGYTRYRFNFDSSSGDIAPTMPNGSFDGQQVILKDTGEANMTRIKGPGFYLGADSGGMYLKSRSILCTWNGDDSEWEMDDAVTADYMSGSEHIINTASGRQKIFVELTLSYVDVTTATATLNYSSPFANINNEISSGIINRNSGGDRFASPLGVLINTATQLSTVMRFNTTLSAGFTVPVLHIITGKY